MTVEKLSKSKERVKKYGEVFTPVHIVKQMCDMLEQESPECWGLDKTILEPTCGTGNFLVEIFARKLKLCKNCEDALKALESIYAIDIMPDNIQESKERMLKMYEDLYSEGRQKAKSIIDKHVICGDSLAICRELESKEWDEVTSQYINVERKLKK